MKKIICFILIGVLCLSLSGCYSMPLFDILFDRQSKKQTLSVDEYLPLAETAIKKIQEINPSFQAKPEECFVSKSKNRDIWYAYVYSTIDKNHGYEVYYENGTYKVNFDNPIYEARISIVEKLNELRPYNKELNGYMHFAPYETYYETIQEGGAGAGALGYCVAIGDNNIDDEMSIDYEILLFYKQLMEDLRLDFKGIAVHYYDGDCPEITIPRNNYFFGEVNRSSYLSYLEGFEYFDIPHMLDKIGSYRINIDDFDNAEDLERIFESKEEFIKYAKNNLTEDIKAKEKNNE